MTSYTPITCPICGTTSSSADLAARVGSLTVCPSCGGALVLNDDSTAVRRATGADTTGLSAEDLQTLRKARGRTR